MGLPPPRTGFYPSSSSSVLSVYRSPADFYLSSPRPVPADFTQNEARPLPFRVIVTHIKLPAYHRFTGAKFREMDTPQL